MKSADYKEQNYQFKTNINMKTKTSILALTKAFFILIVSVCLFSCGSNLPTNKTMETPYIVKSIETFDKGLCLYNLETGVDNINYRDNISVVDSIGKFVIEDLGTHDELVTMNDGIKKASKLIPYNGNL